MRHSNPSQRLSLFRLHAVDLEALEMPSYSFKYNKTGTAILQHKRQLQQSSVAMQVTKRPDFPESDNFFRESLHYPDK
jgi:hypothetical protein